MKRLPRIMNRANMTSATYFSIQHRDRALRLAEHLRDDPSKDKRIAAGLCVVCFYADGRIGGAAMTSQPCGACGEVQQYGNTCTDALCLACATKHNLCKHCGGDSELRPRRRDWPTFDPTPAPDTDPAGLTANDIEVLRV